LDSNSLTKTKNWNGRNEVTETSGRLHLLWPHNKWLHKPRTADYRHTRQDRWIQTELASTLAKNATKSNPFEIIPLQTTRKENNWKTEETLERAVVTVETERIKGSSPWCLWWWWSLFKLATCFGPCTVPSSGHKIYTWGEYTAWLINIHISTLFHSWITLYILLNYMSCDLKMAQCKGRNMSPA